jgi:hypothetical protein
MREIGEGHKLALVESALSSSQKGEESTDEVISGFISISAYAYAFYVVTGYSKSERT